MDNLCSSRINLCTHVSSTHAMRVAFLRTWHSQQPWRQWTSWLMRKPTHRIWWWHHWGWYWWFYKTGWLMRPVILIMHSTIQKCEVLHNGQHFSALAPKEKSECFLCSLMSYQNQNIMLKICPKLCTPTDNNRRCTFFWINPSALKSRALGDGYSFTKGSSGQKLWLLPQSCSLLKQMELPWEVRSCKYCWSIAKSSWNVILL